MRLRRRPRILDQGIGLHELLSADDVALGRLTGRRRRGGDRSSCGIEHSQDVAAGIGRIRRAVRLIGDGDSVQRAYLLIRRIQKRRTGAVVSQRDRLAWLNRGPQHQRHLGTGDGDAIDVDVAIVRLNDELHRVRNRVRVQGRRIGQRQGRAGHDGRRQRRRAARTGYDLIVADRCGRVACQVADRRIPLDVRHQHDAARRDRSRQGQFHLVVRDGHGRHRAGLAVDQHGEARLQRNLGSVKAFVVIERHLAARDRRGRERRRRRIARVLHVEFDESRHPVAAQIQQRVRARRVADGDGLTGRHVRRQPDDGIRSADRDAADAARGAVHFDRKLGRCIRRDRLQCLIELQSDRAAGYRAARRLRQRRAGRVRDRPVRESDDLVPRLVLQRPVADRVRQLNRLTYGDARQKSQSDLRAANRHLADLSRRIVDRDVVIRRVRNRILVELLVVREQDDRPVHRRVRQRRRRRIRADRLQRPAIVVQNAGEVVPRRIGDGVRRHVDDVLKRLRERLGRIQGDDSGIRIGRVVRSDRQGNRSGRAGLGNRFSHRPGRDLHRFAERHLEYRAGQRQIIRAGRRRRAHELGRSRIRRRRESPGRDVRRSDPLVQIAGEVGEGVLIDRHGVDHVRLEALVMADRDRIGARSGHVARIRRDRLQRHARGQIPDHDVAVSRNDRFAEFQDEIAAQIGDVRALRRRIRDGGRLRRILGARMEVPGLGVADARVRFPAAGSDERARIDLNVIIRAGLVVGRCRRLDDDIPRLAEANV